MKQQINYWRNSLADANRLEIDVEKVRYKSSIHPFDFFDGLIPQSLTNEFFAACRGSLQNLREIPVLISPFLLVSMLRHGAPTKQIPEVYPFWIPAVLSQEGKLRMPEKPFPFLPRNVLEPLPIEDQFGVISSVEKVDEVMAAERINMEWKWSEYVDFCERIFFKLTGFKLDQFQIEGFSTQQDCLLVTDDMVKGASDAIINLYNYLCDLKKPMPALLERYASLSPPELKPLKTTEQLEAIAPRHAGQMTGTFALSPSQRRSFYHFLTLQEGEILALNGPPGTGKTTLLQTVIANQVVESALAGGQPVVTVATSNNNQAITNIIESFGKVPQGNHPLSGRWLPELHTYALYLAAGGVNAEDKMLTVKMSNEEDSLRKRFETRDYHIRATAFFLQHCSKYAGKRLDKVADAVDLLQNRLKEIKKQIEEGFSAWYGYKTIPGLLKRYGGKKALSEFFPGNVVQTEKVAEEIKKLQAIHSTGKQNLLEKALLLIFHGDTVSPLFTELAVETGQIAFKNAADAENFVKESVILLTEVLEAGKQAKEWKQSNNLSHNIPNLHPEMDKTLRYEAFQVATHYWEGRWLMETAALLEAPPSDTVSADYRSSKWRRYAMLTPCFVSTFFMLPKFFTCRINGSKTWQPMLEFIDLLLVDEAGQVSPEVGAASFALAKKALVVGDIFQIEPIWKIPRYIDVANLLGHSLIKGYDDEEGISRMMNKGFTASLGSVMKMAQHACEYKLPRHSERGLMLTEHRRCYDGIIAYCNELAYHGDLEPKRGAKKDADFLPAMGYLHISGFSKPRGGSRENEPEALQIAQWLSANRIAIETHYAQRTGKRTSLELLVGIITPFVLQKRALINALRECGLNTALLKVGTVHALQGAERPVVIFSPVHASNEPNSSLFFDRGINMLNVAVSRAQDSFLVFGDMSIFSRFPNSPSGLLGKYLFSAQGNAIEEILPL